MSGVYVQASCGACHESTYGLSGAETVLSGENLFRDRGCSSCHTPVKTVRKFAPPLNGISAKIKDRRWLRAWLQGPRSIRPGTMMPDFGIAPDTACGIASFLLSLNETHAYKQPDTSKASAERGAEYFVYRGCRACHKTHPEISDPVHRIPSLNDAGTKFRPAWVLLELEEPRAYNPDARIPLIEATDKEVLDIIVYLETLTLDPGKLPSPCSGNDRQGLEEGRDFIENNGCFACHRIQGFEHMDPPAARITPRLKPAAGPRPWNDITLTIGLSRQEGETASFRRMPLFHLTEDEVNALAVFFMKAPSSGSTDRFIKQSKDQRAGHEGNMLLNDYGCRLCHLVDEGESPYVATVIERSHLLPPRLTGEGDKVQPQWLSHFLDNPNRLRIWMTMSMPYFYLPPNENQAFVRFFRNVSGFDDSETIAPYQLPFDIKSVGEEEKALGIYRFRQDRCAQCHPVDVSRGLPKNVSLDDLAIDLMKSKHRLRYEWIRNFLQNPDRYAGKDTRMPFIYYTPDSVPKVPDAAKWLDRVARVLYLMDTLPEPDEKENIRDEIDVKSFWENY